LFLYLVDRNGYLLTISNAYQLCKSGGFLAIIDVDTPYNYSDKYSHREGIYSHKTNNSSIFFASGHYTLVNKFQFSHNNFFFDKVVDERIFLGLLYKEPLVYK
jgi:hypothetical protein